MEQCNCRKCSAYTWIDSNGTSQHGRLLSSRNKCKHQRDDYLQSIAPPIPTTVQKSLELLMSKSNYSNSEESDNSHSTSLVLGTETVLTVIVLLFVFWLHLMCACSMETCRIVHNFLIDIIEAAKKQTLENTKLSKDVRTMMNILNIEPQLKELICCEKCYSLYEGANTSEYCTYQPFPKSTNCNTPLFSIKTPFGSIQGQELGISSSLQHQSHNPYQVYLPKTIYYTQDMLEWVKWLLGLPNIELKIYEWKQQLSTIPYVNDIQQEQACKNLQWADCQEGNENCLCLTFSLFIDWFNPRDNKKAEKQDLMGFLLLTCLNLPPKLCHKPDYSLFFGVIPGPNSPNILKPLVDQLLVLKDGVKIPTFSQPQGINIYVQLLPLIGYLVTIHKKLGVASHSGTHFFPWCASQLPNIQLMKLGTTHNGLTILKAAQYWKY